MKIITRAVYQMTPAGFELLEEDSHDYTGSVAEAKGGVLGQIGSTNSALDLVSPSHGWRTAMDSGETSPGAGFTDPGGAANRILDPLDLFGGTEQADAKQAQKDLPGQLTDLNNLQANVSRYNTSGPFGESKWSIDPTTGRYTQTTNLAPSEQRQFDARNQIAEQMMGKAKEWGPASSSNFDYSKEVPALADQQFSKTQSLTAPITNANDAAWKTKMANAGISPTSDAYKEVAGQRGTDAGQAQYQARQAATTAAIPLAQQQRQQRMAEMAQLMGGEQLNSPAQGGTGVDINGATSAANSQGIANANQQAAQRNAMMQSIAGLAGAGAQVGNYNNWWR